MDAAMTDKELIGLLRARASSRDSFDNYLPTDSDLDLEAASRLEALSRSGGAAPQGWKLVPEEPTEEMIEYVNSNCDEPDANLSWTWQYWLSAAPSPPAGSGWLPIEEAPKDQHLLVLDPEHGPQAATFDGDAWLAGSPRADFQHPLGGWVVLHPTHFMLLSDLPAPPSPQPSREG